MKRTLLLCAMLLLLLYVARVSLALDNPYDTKKSTTTVQQPKQQQQIQQPRQTQQQIQKRTPQAGGQTQGSSTVKSSTGGANSSQKRATPQTQIGKQSAPGAVRQLSQAQKTAMHQKMTAHMTSTQIAKYNQSVHSSRGRFATHVRTARFVPAPHQRIILRSMRIAPGTYWYRRTVFYETYGYVPPAYVYGWYPYYGFWDAVWLDFAMRRAIYDAQYAAFFYNHRYDDDIIAWQRDAELQAQQNEELRGKLAELEQRVADLEAQGTPRDESYVPPDAGDVSIAPEVMDQIMDNMGKG